MNLGMVALEQGKSEQAREFFLAPLPMYRELGSTRDISHALINLGLTLHHLHDTAGAQVALEEAIDLIQDLGDTSLLVIAQMNLGRVALQKNNLAQASTLFHQALTAQLALRDQEGIATCLEGFAALAYAQKQIEHMAHFLSAAAKIRAAIGAPLPPVERTWLDTII